MGKKAVVLSFKKKMIWLFMLTNCITLAFTISTFWLYDYSYTKKQHHQKFELISDLTHESIVESLKSRNFEDLNKPLVHLLKDVGFLEVAVFEPDGRPFFSIPQKLNLNYNEYKKGSSNDSLYSKPIHDKDKLIGFLVFKPDSTYFYKDIYAALSLGLVVFCLIILFTFVISKWLVKKSTQPIKLLTETAQRIAKDKDFKLRAEKVSEDEFGILTDAFNMMLKEIQDLTGAHNLQIEMAEDSYNRLKFVLDQTEVTKKNLEYEAMQRINATNHLKKIRNHLDDIINSMPSMLICVDQHGVVTEWNMAVCQLSQKSAEEAQGESLREILPLMTPHIDKVKESIELKQINYIEKYQYQMEGREIFFDILIYPLTQLGDEGAVIRLDDMTTQVRMENMMVQTEKMMSVGGLAAGMAHEINNPLGGILQSIQNMVRRIDPKLPKNNQEAEKIGLDLDVMHQYLENREILKFVDGIKDCGERAAAIVKNMLQFSRKNDNSNFNNADINKIIERSVALAANDYDMKKSYDFRQIEVKNEFQDDLPFVPCVAPEVEQVILNLLRNSAQALHEQVNNKAPMITLKTHYDKDFVYINIQDNGPGMDQDHVSRIFEPFFTTKEVGVGTGLGLSVSYFIINSKHQGAMTVESTPNEGTQFTIALPQMRVEKTGTGDI